MTTRHTEHGMVAWLKPTPGGVRIRVHVQPRASTSSLQGLHGDALKIRLAAPPVDGAANEALVGFLADILKRPRSAVRLTGGAASRRKTVEVTGMDVVEAVRRLGLGSPPG